MLNKTDIAVVVCDINEEVTEEDINIIKKINEKNIPVILVYNKYDVKREENKDILENKFHLYEMETLNDAIEVLMLNDGESIEDFYNQIYEEIKKYKSKQD